MVKAVAQGVVHEKERRAPQTRYRYIFLVHLILELKLVNRVSCVKASEPVMMLALTGI